jgi:hypothetical protein
MVPLPYRSRGDRTALGPWCRAAEARRDGMATLDAGWLDLRSRLVPRRSTRPGSLELRVHPVTWCHQYQGIKVRRKLGLPAANADALARRQQERSAMASCDPGARAGCMTMVPGDQGTKAPGGPSRPLRLGPNIAGPLARRGAFDILSDDPTRFLFAAYPMTTWSIGTMGSLGAGKPSRTERAAASRWEHPHRPPGDGRERGRAGGRDRLRSPAPATLFPAPERLPPRLPDAFASGPGSRPRHASGALRKKNWSCPLT